MAGVVRSSVTRLGTPASISLQHRDRRADLTGCAVPALIAIVLDEGGLHRMQIGGRAQPFNGRDAVAFVHHGKRQAGVDPTPVDHHRAGAALPVIAAFFVPVR